MIYLDNAATTYPKSERVLERMNQVNRNLAVNAGRGGYKIARKASEMIDGTRMLCKELVGADATYETIFSPSATFAVNQVLRGLQWKAGDVILVSPYEHNSVMRTVYALCKMYQMNYKVMKCKEDTTIDLEQLDYELAVEHPKVVIASVVSNVTGYCLPVIDIVRLARENNAISILDASQALGLVPIQVKDCPADVIVWAGHKTLYGPFGIGGVIAKKELLETLEDYLTGGTGSDSLNLAMPEDITVRLEAGSHNIVAIAGVQEALLELKEQTGEFVTAVQNIYLREQELRQYLITRLEALENVRCYPEPSLTNGVGYVGMVSFSILGLDAEDVGDILDEDYDIAVRTGYHCAPLVHDLIGSRESLGTVRVSVGRSTTKKELDALVEALEEL